MLQKNHLEKVIFIALQWQPAWSFIKHLICIAYAHTKNEKLRGLNKNGGVEERRRQIKGKILVWVPAKDANGARSGGLRSQHV
jgi:hypothetical protein